jgi:hypothetical protein
MSETVITIRYSDGEKASEKWPSYDAKFDLPDGWESDDFKGSLNTRKTINAFWVGPTRSSKRARDALEKMYERYQQEGYVSTFTLDEQIVDFEKLCNACGKYVVWKTAEICGRYFQECPNCHTGYMA